MAKKKVSTPRSTAKKQARARTTKQDVTDAEEQLQHAREQLRQAEEYYEEAKVKAAEQIENLRETSLGDVVDRVLKFVKKHPGAGVIGAISIGFIFGRITRR